MTLNPLLKSDSSGNYLIAKPPLILKLIIFRGKELEVNFLLQELEVN